MGDVTNAQLYVYSCPPEEAQAILDFIDSNGLGESWGFRSESPTEKLKLNSCYGAEVSVGIVDECQLSNEAPHASYIIWQDPKYEYLGVVEMFTPELGLFSADCDADGNPILSRQSLLDLIDKQPDDFSMAQFRLILDKAMGGPWTRAFEELRKQIEAGQRAAEVIPTPDIVVGGDGYASHAGCNPKDATATSVRLAQEDENLCWICSEPLENN